MSLHVYPVIHHLDYATTMDQAAMAFECGADGVFVISHTGAESEVIAAARTIKDEYPTKMVGINLLTETALAAAKVCKTSALDMFWCDNVGIVSNRYTANAWLLSTNLLDESKQTPLCFAGVAFKGQVYDHNPGMAASTAKRLGFIPTTSGLYTGTAPDLAKIKAMYEGSGGTLAVASGMDCDNIKEFAPYLKYVLVATGVSSDFHHFNYESLRRFIALAHGADAA